MESALNALLLTCIGALGVLVETIRRELLRNTGLTKEASEAANSRLTEVMDHLAGERNRSMALREIVREREDRIAYIVARHPEVEETITNYRNRRTRRITEAEEIAFEVAILHEADPPQP